ncbi:hypothetical protein R4P70_30635, partial [Rhodococcus sp. IEGM 1241]|uniref:hypothetical protein n=1 Tax=Rhodococcus sp. IEGM 1241 TaxID=3082228 RepID=UPI0029530D5E
ISIEQRQHGSILRTHPTKPVPRNHRFSHNASIAAIGHRPGRSNTSGPNTSNDSNAGILHSFTVVAH